MSYHVTGNTKNTSPSIFADDTKVNDKVDSKKESEFIQSDLDALRELVRHFAAGI